jgi:sulfoquinovosidase
LHEEYVLRIWVELVAEENEYVWGGGEQFTYLNLRGRTYPIWVREQGVGRNLSSDLTQAGTWLFF